MEDITAMHWTVLRKKMEELGLEYKGKDEAVATLSGMAEIAPAESAAAGAVETPASVAKVKGMLDRGRAYGTITGEVAECPTARHTQDGHLYDEQGKKVG